MTDRIDYIKESLDKLHEKFDATVEKHDDRLKSLERTRANQRGIMVGGGAVVTFFAGVVAWVVDHMGGQ